MGLVLESPWNFSERSGKSWNSEGYDAGGGHSDAGADSKISSDFTCIYEKITGGRGSAPEPIVTAVFIFKHCWRTTASWKNVSWILESPGEVLEIFVTKRVGTLVQKHQWTEKALTPNLCSGLILSLFTTRHQCCSLYCGCQMPVPVRISVYMMQL